MCLIPTEVLRTVGPEPAAVHQVGRLRVRRARGAAGFPTVSLPGTAVWHVPWTDKNDALDWQSYFHQRNRTIAALLHSPYEHGGRVVRESFNHQIKHLFSMQYSTAELRHLALEDVLAGPERLHGELGHQAAPSCASCAAGTPTRRPRRTPTPSRPCVVRSRRSAARTPPCRRARSASCSPRRPARLRQLRPKRTLADKFPEARLAALDAKWWMISQFDSVVVSMPDGAQRLVAPPRPRGVPQTCCARTVEIHQRLHREWPRLAREYRHALPDISSPERWAKTFEADAVAREDGS